MTDGTKEELIYRISKVRAEDKSRFGRMNVSQMICHCADQFRMMFGEIPGLKRQTVDLVTLRQMKMRNETVPAPDGLGQVEGGGTKPTGLEKDKATLIAYLNRFHETDSEFKFSFHPYFGEIDKVRWDSLVMHHLNHHLGQFNR